ncbi:hypothetical protein BIV57_11050 [Mangrovactinospora gilvigrisea]|uniref:Uncharacterized protein n=1 Tax=Mangrovactinospora gilvigrisea TaxID=1428644 RepID=A0A1J7C780_9ACTN|nr:hypothetical protein [Mangrovactinospora gilvigrisea]OIV37408.1 hypothetical protein BIV57_11050 [Mangrovactinospora gilvigrisea]
MDFTIRAEYEAGQTPGEPDARVAVWHMSRGDDPRAMCGADLAKEAATQPEDAWGTDAAHPFCSVCGAAYIRSLPR